LKNILILGAALALIAAVVIAGLRIYKATRLWPVALLIVTAPLEVYRSSSGAGANLSLFRFALAVALVAFIVDLARGRKRLPQALPIPFAVYGALVTWQLISLLFVTSNHSLAYRFLGQYVAGLVAALLITCYVERRDLRVVAVLAGSAGVLPLVSAAYRVFSVHQGGSGDLPGLNELSLNPAIEAARQSGSFLLDGTQRLSGTFSDPNHFGFYIATVLLVICGVLCSILFSEQRIAWKGLVSCALLAMSTALAVVGSYSRSTWVMAAVGLIVLVLALGGALWTRRRAMIAGVISLAVLGLASPLIATRLSSSERGNAVSTKEHEHTMSIALKLAAHHPFNGVGLGGYGRYAGEPPIISSAHSTFLTVAAELGIPGVTLLLGAIIMAALGAIGSTRGAPMAERTVLAGFAAAYIGLAVGNIFYEVWMDDFQWVLFGLVLAVTRQPSVALLKARVSQQHGALVSASEQAGAAL
jgi:hypothetical protein